MFDWVVPVLRTGDCPLKNDVLLFEYHYQRMLVKGQSCDDFALAW